MSSGQRLDWVTITRLLLGPDMALGLEASQATKACGSCGSHLAPDANFCRKCGRPREDQGEACRSSARRGGSSSSGAEQSRRRAASVPQKRHSLPNAPSDSEDEVTLEPESLKPVGALKTMSPYNAMSLDSRAVTFLSRAEEAFFEERSASLNCLGYS
ncbi:unnamed protein product [Durusdinium trenchii]|uniref:Zinc-ribbon domain-containing protein n=1 Tax=Durusdinium trenchii TaxID=1381693 RepID=A0ABP0J5S4_9DINO